MVRAGALRERLVPYLYAEAERCRETHDPLIRPVFLADPDHDPESDCFLCGREILVCPVFDEGADNVTVTLPKHVKSWQLRGEGLTIPGGTTVTVPCLPTDPPVWFTAAVPTAR